MPAFAGANLSHPTKSIFLFVQHFIQVHHLITQHRPGRQRAGIERCLRLGLTDLRAPVPWANPVRTTSVCLLVGPVALPAEGTIQFVPDANGNFQELRLNVPNDDLWFDELKPVRVQ